MVSPLPASPPISFPSPPNNAYFSPEKGFFIELRGLSILLNGFYLQVLTGNSPKQPTVFLVTLLNVFEQTE